MYLSTKSLNSTQKEAGSPHRDPETEERGIKKRLRRKSSEISEKGIRHITRLKKMMAGDRLNQFFMGYVEGQKIKLRFDHRDNFNIITSAAVKMIEDNARKLDHIKGSKNIPAYLRNEKKVKFKTVKIRTVVFETTILVEAMILDSEGPCILLGRLACREVGDMLKMKDADAVDPLQRSSEYKTPDTRRKPEKEGSGQPTAQTIPSKSASVSGRLVFDPGIQMLFESRNTLIGVTEVRGQSVEKVRENVKTKSTKCAENTFKTSEKDTQETNNFKDNNLMLRKNCERNNKDNFMRQLDSKTLNRNEEQIDNNTEHTKRQTKEEINSSIETINLDSPDKES